MQADPKDFCCEVMVCDLSISTPNPFLTPAPGTNPTGTPGLPTVVPNPNQSPNPNETPKPIPGTSSPTLNPPITPNPLVTFAPQRECFVLSLTDT